MSSQHFKQQESNSFLKPSKRPRSSLNYSKNKTWMMDVRRESSRQRLSGVAEDRALRDKDDFSKEELAASALLEMRLLSKPSKEEKGVFDTNDRPKPSKQRSSIARGQRGMVGRGKNVRVVPNSSETSEASQFEAEGSEGPSSIDTDPPALGKPLKVRNNRRFATSPHSEFLPQARRLPENGSHSRPNGSSAHQSNLQIRQSMHEARQGDQAGTLNGWRHAQTIPTPPKQTVDLVRGHSCPTPDTDGHSQGNIEQRHASKDVTAVLNHASALMQGHMPIKQPPQTIKLELARPPGQTPIQHPRDYIRNSSVAGQKPLVNPRGGKLTILAPQIAPQPFSVAEPPQIAKSQTPPISQVSAQMGPEAQVRVPNNENQQPDPVRQSSPPAESPEKNRKSPGGRSVSPLPDQPSFGMNMFSALNPTVITTGHYTVQEPTTSQA